MTDAIGALMSWNWMDNALAKKINLIITVSNDPTLNFSCLLKEKLQKSCGDNTKSEG